MKFEVTKDIMEINILSVNEYLVYKSYKCTL